jgi:D-glycero-D-manno-heptose 1,7-bisphosphate phosphatase
MVTNQPNVSRGLASRSEVIKINNYIKEQMNLDDIYCCFHDNKDNCRCRKPKAGMFIRAKKKWDINLKASIMVGDRKKDIDAGKKAGCKNFFLDYDYNEIKPSKKNCTYIKSFKEIKKYIK